MRSRRLPPLLFYGLLGLVGVAGFLYPFWLPSEAAPGDSHRLAAPLLAGALMLLMVVAVSLEVQQGRMNGATVAVLGVLAASAGLLRLVDLPGGGSGIFFLVILAGAAFGARFGLLLGLSAMALSALITGGIGPWLPFQMLGLGAIGAASGAVGRGTERLPAGAEIAALATFGWVCGFLYGALLNLWSWPFTIGEGPLSWHPELGLGQTIAHYWRFYVATSLAWDAAGALANALLIVITGGAILGSLRRFAHRLAPVVLLDGESGGSRPDVLSLAPQRAHMPSGGGSRSKSGAVPQP